MDGAIMARSENWRINKSGLMAVEGACLLRAMKKVAGAAGLPGDYKVRFETGTHGAGIDFEDKELVIGAGRLFTEAPLPADKMDVLVGLVIHETEHYNIGTREVWDRCRYDVPLEETGLFRKFLNIGEDIVIESKTRANKNLAEYDKALHDWAIGRVDKWKAGENRLLDLWIEYGLLHRVDYEKVEKLPDEMRVAFGELVAFTGWLRKVPGGSDRVEAYLKYWNAVKKLVLEPPKPDTKAPELPHQSSGKGDGQESGEAGQDKPDTGKDDTDKKDSGSDKSNDTEQGEDGVDGDTGKSEPDSTDKADDGDESGDVESDEPGELDRPLAHNAGDAIDDGLAQAIQKALESDQEDVTEEVAVEFQKQQCGYRSEYPIIRSRETHTPKIRPDMQLRKRLERVMTIRKGLQRRTLHGENYGKIDARHLERIGTDARVFKLGYKFPDGFPETRILLDLSGSMRGGQADEVLEAACALSSLIGAQVWCYYYADSVVKLIRVDDGRMIHRCESTGFTPSGLAIVGVSIGMKKGGMVLHLTDGEHNHGQAPWSAHWALQKRGIGLINMLWGGNITQYNLNGMNWRKLSGLGDFPDALYQVMVEQAKLG